VKGAVESEANTTRIAEAQSERPLATPEKVSVTPADSPPALPAVGARAEENAHQDRTAHLEKVDMDLFQWPKFIVSLTRKEKEDDFFAIKGTKLPVRPKRRSKHLEKAVTVSGLFLTCQGQLLRFILGFRFVFLFRNASVVLFLALCILHSSLTCFLHATVHQSWSLAL
jgi:hypothetical protein